MGTIAPWHDFYQRSCSSFLHHVIMCHNKCDRACENRTYGLKYTMSFDKTYLIAEIYYLNSVSSVLKPNKLSTSSEIFVAVLYWNKKL